MKKAPVFLLLVALLPFIATAQTFFSTNEDISLTVKICQGSKLEITLQNHSQDTLLVVESSIYYVDPYYYNGVNYIHLDIGSGIFFPKINHLGPLMPLVPIPPNTFRSIYIDDTTSCDDAADAAIEIRAELRYLPIDRWPYLHFSEAQMESLYAAQCPRSDVYCDFLPGSWEDFEGRSKELSLFYKQEGLPVEINFGAIWRMISRVRPRTQAGTLRNKPY